MQHAKITYIKITHKKTTKKYRRNIPRPPSHDSRENRREIHSVIPHYCFRSVFICNSLTPQEHASRFQQASLVWRQKPAAIHEHTHGTTTERDNRLMRSKTGSTNGPTKVTNAKKYGRHVSTSRTHNNICTAV